MTDDLLRYIIKPIAEKECGCLLAYKSEEAIEVHKSTQHFLDWRNNVQVMMAAPRIGVKIKNFL